MSMSRAFIGVTDHDWYDYLSHRPDLTEVNFWQPGGHVAFKALDPGELFLFKLHSPNNYIVGGGFFATSSLLPVSIACLWRRQPGILGHCDGSQAWPGCQCVGS